MASLNFSESYNMYNVVMSLVRICYMSILHFLEDGW